MRHPARRLLPLAMLPILVSGSLAPLRATVSSAASPTLSVRAVSPSPGATEVSPSTAVLVAFDRPVVALVGVGETPPPSPLVSDPPLAGQGRWVTSSIYSWQAAALHAATRYTVRVRAGLKAIDGTHLNQDYTWSFATFRPAVRDVSPADGYADAVPRPLIALTFNQRMEHASTEAAFHLRDAQGRDIPGVFSWKDGALHYRPIPPLVRTATYTATLDGGAHSAEGPLPLLQPISWHFSVAPYLRITDSKPRGGDRAADMSNGVEIDFSAPVDETSAIDAVRISPDLPGRYVSFGSDDLSLTITGNFAPSTAYTVRVKAGLLARAGDRLPIPFASRFVSAPLPPQLYFVTGNVASYDAYRPLVLSLQAINPGAISYTVYRLSRDEFVADLGRQYELAQNPPSSGEEVLAFRGVPAAPLNKATPIQVQLLLPGDRPLRPGFYLVRAAGDGKAADFQLFVVTRTNLTIKVAQRQVLLWATDLASGQPVPSLPLQVVAQNTQIVPAGAGGTIGGDQVIAAGKTAAGGTLMLDVPGVPPDQALANGGVLAVGGRADDAVVVSTAWNSGVGPYDFGLSYSGGWAPIRLSLYTDRPIYRPGQAVHVRGLVRADDDGRYSLVGGPVSLVLTDPKGQIVSRQTVILDRFGAFHADFTLAGNASLGGYSLNATSGNQGTYASLQVAEYRKPTFTVTVSAAHATYTVGEHVDADVRVAYYFGGPVAHARVHWSMLGYNYTFFAYDYADYAFGAYDPAAALSDVVQAMGAQICIDCRQGGYTLFQGDALTDANGRLHLHLPARLPRGQTMQSYNLEANVTDLDNQPVAGSTGLTVFASAFQIGLQPEKQIVDPGVAQRVRIVTVRDDGAGGVPNQRVRVAIYRRTYSNVVIHHSDGSTEQQYVPHDAFLSSQTVTTDVRGQAAISFTAARGGEYHLVASARDRFGNATQSSVEIYAGGEKPIDWGFQRQGHIRLVTDKRTYRSGDVAHILVTAPFPNMLALISIERGHILSYRVQRLSGTGTTLDLPVPASYLPDTYVSVVVEQGAGSGGPPPVWRLGYAHIHVDTQERAIRLTVRPGRARVLPGQPVPLRIHATDYRGRPLQAQLSLSVVDAAALALAGDSGTGAGLLDLFYGTRPLGVTTANTLNISPEQLLTKRIIPVRAFAKNDGTGAGGSAVPAPAATASLASADHVANQASRAPGGGPAITVRSHFADTAYWNASVVTDAAGNATLTVPLPDNTTTWQILGQGISADTLVGAGTATVMATKDLLLRPLLPRFFTLGDTAMVGATINNTTDRPLTAQVRLLLADGVPGLALAPMGVRTIHLAAHGEQDVTWPVHIAALGTATVQVQAIDVASPTTNDAVQLALPVTENSTPEDVATAGQAGAHTQEAVAIPAGIEPNEGSLTLTLEPTLAAGLRVGADFLRTYPYESSIDLAAKILGEAELARLPSQAAVLTVGERTSLRPEIARLLRLLYPMQHGDGGFGWWIDDPYSSPYITVYVMQSLTVARDLGYPADPTSLSNAARYLLANTRLPAATNAGANYDANLQVEIVSALTQYGRGGDVADLGAALFDARYLLDQFARADLAVALAAQRSAADQARVKTLLADLIGSARLSGAGAHWDQSAYDWQALDSDIAGTATILDALTVLDPHNPLIANTVRWLMAARKANAWESTFATAASLRGLVDYTLGSGELNGHYRYAVSLNGTGWGEGAVNAGNLAQTRTLTQPIGPQAPAGSTQRITVGRDVRPGNGQLHYVIRLRYFRPVDRINPVSAGVSVTRRYLTADGRSAPLGSAVRVQLTVTAPQDLFYLVLEDPLPAGAESVDSSLHTTTQLAQIQGHSTIPTGTSNLTWYVTHTDLRDSRTVLFLDYLPAGTYQYTYLIHCSTQGVFHTLPTHIQQAYFPEVFGRSNGSYFRVR